MYHARFKGNHYACGYRWGDLLYRKGKQIAENDTFVITEERRTFANQCIPIYEQYAPELLEEIRGIADGQRIPVSDLLTFLLSMYCFRLDHHCTCFALHHNDTLLLGRNSDFLCELEHLYMNCYYQMDHTYAFNANTTAFVEMEDGVNAYGLAVGMTFVYPNASKPGFHAGMLVRYLLEHCKTTQAALDFLTKVPIASAQTLVIADAGGNIAAVECNCDHVCVIKASDTKPYVVTSNVFHCEALKSYRLLPGMDDWRAKERYQVADQTLKVQKQAYSVSLAKDLLSGKYGFMCQYDRKTGADTVWSVIYDIKNKQIYRAEGNPARKKYREDKRMIWMYP